MTASKFSQETQFLISLIATGVDAGNVQLVARTIFLNKGRSEMREFVGAMSVLVALFFGFLFFASIVSPATGGPGWQATADGLTRMVISVAAMGMLFASTFAWLCLQGKQVRFGTNAEQLTKRSATVADVDD